jgi:hypothetical protein
MDFLLSGTARSIGGSDKKQPGKRWERVASGCAF